MLLTTRTTCDPNCVRFWLLDMRDILRYVNRRRTWYALCCWHKPHFIPSHFNRWYMRYQTTNTQRKVCEMMHRLQLGEKRLHICIDYADTWTVVCCAVCRSAVVVGVFWPVSANRYYVVNTLFMKATKATKSTSFTASLPSEKQTTLPHPHPAQPYTAPQRHDDAKRRRRFAITVWLPLLLYLTSRTQHESAPPHPIQTIVHRITHTFAVCLACSCPCVWGLCEKVKLIDLLRNYGCEYRPGKKPLQPWTILAVGTVILWRMQKTYANRHAKVRDA